MAGKRLSQMTQEEKARAWDDHIARQHGAKNHHLQKSPLTPEQQARFEELDAMLKVLTIKRHALQRRVNSLNIEINQLVQEKMDLQKRQWLSLKEN